jgi:ATP-dependent helicase HrpA/adenine-specific DNA-methyltransferase
MKTRHRIHPILLQRAREMRQPQTAAEATLWRAVRNRNLVYKFRRQHPIDRFIIDFYCAQAKLCIELDGESHLEPDEMEYDKVRTEYLKGLGYKVIRFTNNDVRYNIQAVVDTIVKEIESLLSTPSPLQGAPKGVLRKRPG